MCFVTADILGELMQMRYIDWLLETQLLRLCLAGIRVHWMEVAKPGAVLVLEKAEDKLMTAVWR